jgi:hypothetical protein
VQWPLGIRPPQRVEFQQFGMSMEEAKEKFWEGSEIILKPGRVKLFPITARTIDPPISRCTCSRCKSPCRQSGSLHPVTTRSSEPALGLPMMGIPFARSNNLADVKANIDLYSDTFAQAGHAATPRSWSPGRAGTGAPLFRACHLIPQNQPAAGIEDPRAR